MNEVKNKIVLKSRRITKEELAVIRKNEYRLRSNSERDLSHIGSLRHVFGRRQSNRKLQYHVKAEDVINIINDIRNDKQFRPTPIAGNVDCIHLCVYSFPENNAWLILYTKVPILSISEHFVGPFFHCINDLDNFVMFQKDNFILHEKYLQKREIQTVTNRHPSSITGLSMVSAICASDILNYFSKVAPCRLNNVVYSLQQESLTFKTYNVRRDVK